MKPIAIIAIIAAVVVVGGACAGVAFSGVLNGGTTGPEGDDPVVPTDPVDPTPTETPTETPTDSSMSYFSPMTSSGSSSSGSGSSTLECVHTFSEAWTNDTNKHWHASTCGHDVKKDEAYHSYAEDFDCTVGGPCTTCGFVKVAEDHTWGEWIPTQTAGVYSHTCTLCSARETGNFLAAIGQEYYATLNEALNDAADGDTVTLLADMETTVTIPEGKKVIINPNGNVTKLNYESVSDINVQKNLGEGSALSVANDMEIDYTVPTDADLLIVNYAKNDTAMHICTAAGLVAFGQFVNHEDANIRDTFAGKTVKLMNNIDLAGITWTPIGTVESYPSTTFAGTFDGQENTISNMEVEISGYGGEATGGFFGSITGKVLNLNIDHATVKSTHYAGGIVGYSSSNVGMEIRNCKVTNSYITSIPELMSDGVRYDNGDKTGGIIGNMVAGDVVTGCTVENTKIEAYRDLGGIAGNCDGSLTNNIVNAVTLVQNNTNGYKSEVIMTIGELYGRTANGVGDVSGNKATDVQIIRSGVTTTENIKNIISSNDKVSLELPAGTHTLPTISSAQDSTPKDVTITGTKDTVIDLTNAVTAADSTITFEGISVKVDGGGLYEGIQHAKKVVYKACTLDGTQFMYSAAEFTDCTFNVIGDNYNIWTYGNTVTFTDCTFNCDGKAVLVYNEGAVTATVTFNNCEFNDNGDGTVNNKAAVEVGESAYGNKATYTIVMNDCTVNGFDINSAGTSTGSTYWGNKNSMPVDRLSVTIDGVKADWTVNTD